MPAKHVSSRKLLFHSVKQKARRVRRGRRIYFAQPLEKGIRIIDYLKQQQGAWCGVRQLAAALQISPSTASRILRIFFQAGWVIRRGEGRQIKYALLSTENI